MISADGRFIAFYSGAGDLVEGDTNLTLDVFVRDRELGTTERVSVTSDGSQANNGSWNPAISGDGRFVAFQSDANNLAYDPHGGGHTDIFVRDLLLDTTERVSVSSAEGDANYQSYNPSISHDGRYVTFDSLADNLVEGDSNGTLSDVFIRDLALGTTERVSVSSDEVQGNGSSYGSSISDNGRYVTFISTGTSLVEGDTSGSFSPDIFVRDLELDTTTRVNVSPDGIQANNTSYDPAISGDGRYISFYSDASNLVADDTNGIRDVFVVDGLAQGWWFS